MKMTILPLFSIYCWINYHSKQLKKLITFTKPHIKYIEMSYSIRHNFQRTSTFFNNKEFYYNKNHPLGSEAQHKHIFDQIDWQQPH